MSKFLNILFGDPNKKALGDLQEIVDQINDLESQIQKTTDAELKNKTTEFKLRLKNGETTDDLLPEAFAVVREVAKRTLSQRHYDVQLMGGIIMHRGSIAEMRTGEGKTLTATLALYLNALSGKGAHLVTVNDYLARRDMVWMAQIYHFLGLSCSTIQHQTSFLYDPNFILGSDTEAEKKADEIRDEIGDIKVETDYLRPVSRHEAYEADITYGTNNEFGFDYLRDNMAPTFEQMVQKPLHYSIVDEVDSILIDEARTPLIISAPTEKSNALYYRFAEITKTLKENDDYNIDEKMRAATLTEAGITKIEKALGIKNLYEVNENNLQYFADNALKAQALYKKDVHYVIKNDEVIIVDEFTGRLMQGRRFGEGQHQAIEAKEGVTIQKESQTLATITFQNYFRMYEKLSGMTGTAVTEAEEFGKIYNLDVMVIPTNLPPKRTDFPDRIYKNEIGKFKAVAKEVKALNKKGQPVLLGTVSIEKNELLAKLFEKEGIKFNILNAKNHAKEAEYIAQAGRIGAVTLATNMAGRGVDIKLGGNPVNLEEEKKVKELGGLHVLGTERHESRRIDNQLRGRAGRQGDAGSTQFYVSLDDDLMRIFAGDRVKKAMEMVKLPEDVPIENKMVSKSIEKSQTRVEGHNFDIRKHLIEYDDVLNKHREVIYGRRREILEEFAHGQKDSLKEKILELVEDEIEQVILFHTNEGGLENNYHYLDLEKETNKSKRKGDWDIQEITEVITTIISLTEEQKRKLNTLTLKTTQDKLRIAEQRTELIKEIMVLIRQRYDELEKDFPERKELHNLERAIIIRAIDTLWIDHLSAMTALRHGIGLQGYGQHDPLVEYKTEGHRLFRQFLDTIEKAIVHSILNIEINKKESPQPPQYFRRTVVNHRQVRQTPGRNDPCPCGSGKKYKKCCWPKYG